MQNVTHTKQKRGKENKFQGKRKKNLKFKKIISRIIDLNL